MYLMDHIAMLIGYAILGGAAAFGTAFILWFLFVSISEWFIKKYLDWDIFCDAVVMAHRKRGIDARRIK